ncbi:MAG: DUF169 domain-containing protein [Thermodesulfobacteriota bacterium]
METRLEWKQIREYGMRMVSILGLSSSPVGVRFLSNDGKVSEETERLLQHRYCQAVMKARRGGDVLLDGEGISCPAAAAAFGFRPLPQSLQSGQGLIGFGIVSDKAIGKQMFIEMPRLDPGKITKIHLFPLEKAQFVPDLVVVEDEVEKLMWIVLSYLHANGGRRVPSSTAVLQATCVDSTLIPLLKDRLNFGYGCYGCRDATDIGNNETLLGFPIRFLAPIMEHLEFLARKAIPTSRSKKAWHALQKEETSCETLKR